MLCNSLAEDADQSSHCKATRELLDTLLRRGEAPQPHVDLA
jgi:hypothetical protein